MGRKKLLTWVLYSLCALAAAALQTLVLSRLRVWGVHPFILPVTAAVIAVFPERRTAVAFGAFLGFVCDLVMPDIMPCFYLVTFALAALLTNLLAQRVISTPFLCALAGAGIALALNGLGHGAVLLLLYGSAHGALLLLVQETVLSVLGAVPLFFLLRWVNRYLSTV